MLGVNEANKFFMWIETFRGPGLGEYLDKKRDVVTRGMFKMA
jgi:hypothetical protein